MSPEHIITQDIKQSGADARICQTNPEHGRLTVHGSGMGLVCLNRVSRQGEKLALCEYAEPLGR